MAVCRGVHPRSVPPRRLRLLPTRPWRFGFFLEYDRGTEKPSRYAAKLATYYRHRNSGGYRRDYQSFPTLLVVTTTDRAEERFAHQAYLAEQQHAGNPLQIFLTTTNRVRAHPGGILGPIWRAPGCALTTASSARARWLPKQDGSEDSAYWRPERALHRP